MDYADFLLFPVYVAVFYLYLRYRRNKIPDPVLQKYYLPFFWIKVIATLFAALFNFYIVRADSFGLFYTEGHNLYQLILSDIANIKLFFIAGKDFDVDLVADRDLAGHYRGESTYLIIKLVAFFSFFTFGKYLLVSLFFSILCFLGVWKLFKFFYHLYPHLNKQLSLAILFLPSFVFWSSGVLKEAISVAALGWITYNLFFLFYDKKHKAAHLVGFFISSYLLFTVKSYILLSYLPFMILYLISLKLQSFKSRFKKIFVAGFIIAVCLVTYVNLIATVKSNIGGFAIDNLFEQVKNQKKVFEEMSDVAESYFSTGSTFDGTFSSFLKASPGAIVATFYRPFIWESKKLSTLISSLESLVIMLFTIWVLFKAGILSIIKSLFKNPTILFCLLFSLVFAIFVGITTLNFGTLVRYKIPCLPFYLIALILILDYTNKRKKLRNQMKASEDLPYDISEKSKTDDTPALQSGFK